VTLRVLVALVVAGCGSATPAAGEPEAVVHVAPVAQAPPAPANQPRRDVWCDTKVLPLEREASKSELRLRDVAATTAMITIARSALAKSDCTSIGHHHLAFEIVDGAPAGAHHAYVKLMLPVTGTAPPPAPMYLLGATRAAARDLDLNGVCVPWRGAVDADARWVVPLADEADAERWRERLRAGLCGRPAEAAH
jgi:hypothetical protein